MSIPDSRWLKAIAKAPPYVMLAISLGAWVGCYLSPLEPAWMRPLLAAVAVATAAIPLLACVTFVFHRVCLPALVWCRSIPKRRALREQQEREEVVELLRTVLAYDHFDENRTYAVAGERYEPPETPPTTEEFNIAMEKLKAMGVVPLRREHVGSFARRFIPLVAAYGVRGAKRRASKSM